MKKIAITSIILIIIPALLFVPLYIIISITAAHNDIDYSRDVIGTWEAFQYYEDSKMFVCDDENALVLDLTVDSLSVIGTGTILKNVDSIDYKWTSGVSISYQSDMSETILFVSFNSRGNLQIKTEDGSKTILLRRVVK
ncbi:hypothetical protein GKG40_20710 [Eubacterium sp. BIOML-A1]|uniref:hypothetical protein n=1 Tax=unclassified Eubacterium (in: firmicutes) TaxID=2624479 RepID=UPI001020B2A0|nr:MULTISPECIES: hypothetical protein [unclassified Eubacterium (in: firmicutes)]MSC86285.1 hypothetical protein [Eubacterium sp. BIOML-A1]MSD07246.1 hypothetical protein [Eubacterium sp. BIOML-A2]